MPVMVVVLHGLLILMVIEEAVGETDVLELLRKLLALVLKEQARHQLQTGLRLLQQVLPLFVQLAALVDAAVAASFSELVLLFLKPELL